MRLTESLSKLPGLILPTVPSTNSHVYYVYGIKLDLQVLTKGRDWFVDALREEGVTGLFSGYQNIHLLPLFKHKIAYGSSGFPWRGLSRGISNVSYELGICPVAEELHSQSFIGLNLCAHDYNDLQTQQIIAAFQKVSPHAAK